MKDVKEQVRLLNDIQRESSELMEERIKLCDLLMGRWFRMRAAELLFEALVCEQCGCYMEADLTFRRAAHAEWIAVITERGKVIWGNRVNRLISENADV